VFDLADAEDAADDENMSTISEEMKPQLRELLAKLQSQLPGPVVQGAWATLSGDEQQALSQL
jgi:hypothetical protein